MAIANNLTLRNHSIQANDEVLEKVLLNQDLSPLTPAEKVQYMGNLCKTLGLNPHTKPFEIIKFNGKEVPYARKDCTEQLRKLHKVSIVNIDCKIVGDIYVVTSYGETMDGVRDSATGAVFIGNLKGEALANAMMKAETKSKRRLTLSICGLGMLDESEIDSLPKPQASNFKGKMEEKIQAKITETEESFDIDQDLLDIGWTTSIENLKEVYGKAYKKWMNKKHKENMDKCVNAKDKKLAEFEDGQDVIDAQIVDSETGEIK